MGNPSLRSTMTTAERGREFWRGVLLAGGFTPLPRWTKEPVPGIGDAVSVQIRHRTAAVAGTILRIGGDEIELALDEPATAIAPGQSLVVYDGDRVLGGGVIERQAGLRMPLPLAS